MARRAPTSMGNATADEARDTARLLISCPDGPGIVAAVSGFLFGRGANIIASDQFSTHPERGTFFMRTVFFLPELERGREEFEAAFGGARQALLDELADLLPPPPPARGADGLARPTTACSTCCGAAPRGARHGDRVRDLQPRASCATRSRGWGCPTCTSPSRRETKREAERRALEVLAGEVDLVVLARYMQILSRRVPRRRWAARW